jgi:hypothetical protein
MLVLASEPSAHDQPAVVVVDLHACTAPVHTSAEPSVGRPVIVHATLARVVPASALLGFLKVMGPTPGGSAVGNSFSHTCAAALRDVTSCRTKKRHDA